MNVNMFVQELSKLRPSSTFLTLHNYINEAGEKADYNLVFHISYRSAVERSLKMLQQSISDGDPINQQARKELIDSFTTSLHKMETTSEDNLEDHYLHFTDADGKPIKGLKLHRASNTLHLYGSVVKKIVHTAGTYKNKSQRPLTVAKDKLKRTLPVGAFRQFKITPEQVERISVENMTLLPPEI